MKQKRTKNKTEFQFELFLFTKIWSLLACNTRQKALKDKTNAKWLKPIEKEIKVTEPEKHK
jgi:hypothetical protein